VTLEPILNAPLEIQIHVVAAILAISIGPFSILRKRRDNLHKTLGVIWIAAMLVVATTALFINEIRMIGPFSPIHVFSIITYHGLWRAISHLRAGRYLAHGRAMKSLYLSALGIAGLFTFLPGRRMNQVLFGNYENEGFMVVMTIGALAALWLILNRRRTAST